MSDLERAVEETRSETPTDPVKLANEYMVCLADYREHGEGGYPDYAPWDQHTLARAVIAQAEEIERLKGALAEALARWQGWTDKEYSGTKYYDSESARIAELRKLVMP